MCKCGFRCTAYRRYHLYGILLCLRMKLLVSNENGIFMTEWCATRLKKVKRCIVSFALCHPLRLISPSPSVCFCFCVYLEPFTYSIEYCRRIVTSTIFLSFVVNFRITEVHPGKYDLPVRICNRDTVNTVRCYVASCLCVVYTWHAIADSRSFAWNEEKRRAKCRKTKGCFIKGK